MSAGIVRSVGPRRQVARPSRERALTRALRETAGVVRPGRHVEAIHRRSVPEASSWTLEAISLSLDDGDSLPLLLKDFGRPLDLGGRSAGKPDVVADARRELWTHRTLLEPTRMSVPRLFHAISGPGFGPLLFLEWVEGTRLAETAFGSAWEAAARWIARFHRLGTEALVRSEGDEGSILAVRHSPRLHHLWFRRALQFVGGGGRAGGDEPPAGCTGSRPTRLARLEGAHERATEILSTVPSVALHGEYYPANILVEKGSLDIRPVDWEMTGFGPGLLDLAALTTGLSRQRQARVVAAYREESRASGAEPLADRIFAHRLQACRLLLAVQWLGWADHWEAPPEQRYDWLAEAERMAKEIES